MVTISTISYCNFSVSQSVWETFLLNVTIKDFTNVGMFSSKKELVHTNIHIHKSTSALGNLPMRAGSVFFLHNTTNCKCVEPTKEHKYNLREKGS